MQPHHVQQGHPPPHPHQNGYATNAPNGHHNPPNGAAQNGSQAHRNPGQHPPREAVNVYGIPSVTVENEQLVVGDSQSSSLRSYTPLKVVGDGSFGTVWLCDWHGTLPPNTPMSTMQCGAGARPEYAHKRLVAVKRMKKTWAGGWDECKRLKELESLRAIPYHPNIIPLYDFFLLPETKELYFVFESMEGNLYQLIKSRKGKPLAGGLVSSIFRQVVEGLHHIHESGYFHRDMKPENLLVTTTGLHDYRPVNPDAPPHAPPEKDVVVIIKLADFGLARETKSAPPYTEYVSTRWYRAPEVLLRSKNYSNPVDMWALGAIMAELVNLRPMFPGQNELDQIARICEVLGDPTEDYGVDKKGRANGGGQWPAGVKLARNTGFAFQKSPPRNIYAMFDRNVPLKLVECIADLLKYDPSKRLTSLQCLEHPYLAETVPLNNPPGPPTQPPQFRGPIVPCRVEARMAMSMGHHSSTNSNTSLPSIAPRNIPPSHSHPNGNPKMHPPSIQIPPTLIPGPSSTHRSSFYDSGFASAHSRSLSESSRQLSEYSGDVTYSPRGIDASHMDANRAANIAGWLQQGQLHPPDWDPMDVSPSIDASSQASYVTAPHHPMDIQTSPMAQEYPARPPVEASVPSHGQGKFPKLFGKKPTKWGLGMFGHGDKNSQQSLPPVQESTVASSSPPSLKRRESSSTDSRSLSELSPAADLPRPPQQAYPEDAKQAKKERERLAKEAAKDAAKQRRLLVEKKQREQARAVMQNNRRLAESVPRYNEVEWLSGPHGGILPQHPTQREWEKGKQPASIGPIRKAQPYGTSSLTINAAGGSFLGSSASPVVTSPPDGSSRRGDWQRDNGRLAKARRRDYDDDHSMSSDLHPGRMSVISFATVDSDPGPGRRGTRHGPFGMNRMTSVSSLRSSTDDFSLSGRSSASQSLEQQLVNDFHLRASVDSASISDGGSPQPPPMHMLSLSSPIPWQHSHSDLSGGSTVDNRSIGSSRQHQLSSPLSPPPQPRQPGPFHLGPQSPYESPGGVYGPSSPGMAPKSAINPIFKVPSFSSISDRPSLSLTSLPPFSQLEAVADGGEYPPLSPMSFTIPEEETEISGEDS